MAEPVYECWTLYSLTTMLDCLSLKKKKVHEILFGKRKYFKTEGFYPIPNCWIHLYLTVKETKYMRARQQRMKKKKLGMGIDFNVVGIFRILNHPCFSCSDSRLHHFSWCSGAPTRHSLPQHYSFRIASCSGYISPFYSFLPNTKSKYSSMAP